VPDYPDPIFSHINTKSLYRWRIRGLDRFPDPMKGLEAVRIRKSSGMD
jgi:hypothetical protein